MKSETGKRFSRGQWELSWGQGTQANWEPWRKLLPYAIIKAVFYQNTDKLTFIRADTVNVNYHETMTSHEYCNSNTSVVCVLAVNPVLICLLDIPFHQLFPGNTFPHAHLAYYVACGGSARCSDQCCARHSAHCLSHWHWYDYCQVESVVVLSVLFQLLGLVWPVQPDGSEPELLVGAGHAHSPARVKGRL